MGMFGRQFGRPTGPVGRLVGTLMARGNAPLNIAAVRQLHDLHPHAERIVEVGCGPGVGLSALLSCYPDAHVVGIDRSPVMVAQSRARNAEAIRAGRLHVREGDMLEEIGPVDLMLAVHVVYFWHEPAAVLHHARTVLAGGGVLGLGYRCRRDMPRPARRDFPQEGHRLYDSEQDVAGLLTDSGFEGVENHLVAGNTGGLGWLTVGRAR